MAKLTGPVPAGMVLPNVRVPVPRDRHIQGLMRDLIWAIELAPVASEAGCAAVAEHLKGNVGDREFLSALSIRFGDG